MQLIATVFNLQLCNVEIVHGFDHGFVVFGHCFNDSKKTLQHLCLTLMFLGVMGVVGSMSIGFSDKLMKVGSHC